MSSFLRQLASRLQTSSSARYALYGVAAAGTTAVTWKYHAQSRNERLERRNAAKAAHARNTIQVSPVKDDKHQDATGEPTITGEADGEEEAGNTGAYDPVTGEINWDCPCLGGMAHGPCGPQFRLAFSCFVYSEAEPKGMDCVEKFKEMQDCFREHPDIYAEELGDDGEEDDNESPSSSTTPPPESPPGSGGIGVEIPLRPEGEPKPTEDGLKLPGDPPSPTPQPKPPITPPPLPPADPKPPTISDPPAGPTPPPTIIDPPAGPVRGGIATTRQRNPPRTQPPRD